jgi:hypothetical protein
MINPNLKPKDVYTRTIKRGDKLYEVTINVYSESFKSSKEVSLQTHVDIRHDDKPWGYFYLPQPIPKEGAEGVFEEVRKNLFKYKTT